MDGKRKSNRLFGQRGASEKLEAPPKEDGFSFSDYGKWKIVSVRLDPCAPTLVHNLNPVTKSMTEAPKAFDETKCQPQLRLIAQPIHAREYDPEFARERGAEPDENNPKYPGAPVKAADFTMHLLYRLDKGGFVSALEDLRKLKEVCGDVTRNRALGVHPCLAARAFGAKFAEDPDSLLRGIIRKHATAFTTFAFMGTELSMDPWVFFGGTVTPAGELMHLQLPALMIDPKTNQKGANGKHVRIPFGNGYYQMLTLQMANGLPIMDRVRAKMDGSPAVPATSKSPAIPAVPPDTRDPEVIAAELFEQDALRQGQMPVTPVANKERVVKDISHYLVPSFLNATFEDISASKESGQDITPLLKQIGNFYQDANIVTNPVKVDFFATDCISCHMVDSVFRTMEQTLNIQAPDQLLKYVSANSFQPAGDYPERPAADAYKETNYEVVNFGYFHDRPSVGMRTVNESIHALEMINASFAPHQRVGDTCPQRELAVCILGLNRPFQMRFPAVYSSRFVSYAELECRKQVCKDAPIPSFHELEKPRIAKLKKGAMLKGEPKQSSELFDSSKCVPDLKNGELPIYFAEKEMVAQHHKIYTPIKCGDLNTSTDAVYVYKDQVESIQ